MTSHGSLFLQLLPGPAVPVTVEELPLSITFSPFLPLPPSLFLCPLCPAVSLSHLSLSPLFALPPSVSLSLFLCLPLTLSFSPFFSPSVSLYVCLCVCLSPPSLSGTVFVYQVIPDEQLLCLEREEGRGRKRRRMHEREELNLVASRSESHLALGKDMSERERERESP